MNLAETDDAYHAAMEELRERDHLTALDCLREADPALGAAIEAAAALANSIFDDVPFIATPPGPLTLDLPGLPTTAWRDSAMIGESRYDRAARDLYSTPRDVGVALCRALIGNRLLAPGSTIWEPACGEWKLAEVLQEHFARVIGTDIVPLDERGHEMDFLKAWPRARFDAIITNPPFNAEGGTSADDFIARGLQHLRRGRADLLALLMRNEFDCGVGRLPVFGHCPEFVGKIVLTWRPRWIEGSTGSPRHNYAWYVWKAVPKESLIVPPRLYYAVKDKSRP